MPKSKSKKAASSDSDSGPDDRAPVKKSKKEEREDELTWDLGKMRKIKLSEFKGRWYVNIREYYDADGEIRPGKKGIGLSMEQWRKLREFSEEIDEAIKKNV